MIPAFGEIGEALRRSTVGVRDGRRSGGSGVIWNSEGLIVTNAHVATSRRMTVELWDGREYPAELAVRDSRRDLATLRVQGRQLPAATVGDSERVRPGEMVIAVGNPLGFTGALSTGVIHSSGVFPGLGQRRWIQADVRLAPGNSGGPLADSLGRVIGLNTMVVSGGLALAVPVEEVRRVLSSGPSMELGVTVREVRLPAGRGIGLVVLEVGRGSAAEQASLLVGDVLTAANGRPFAGSEDLLAAIDGSGGGTLSLEFLRGDRTRTRTVSVRLERKAAA